jgi:uncharacterized protein YfdQ (DUF2303 family)
MTNEDTQNVDYLNRVFNLGALTRVIMEKPDQSGSFVIVPEGMTVKDIPNQEWIGNHVRQSIALVHPGSLSEYLNTYKDCDGRTAIFADPENSVITAILNYHEAGAVNRCDHRATLKIPFDETYARWAKMDGVATDQVDFARFLEEHAIDIVEPDAGSIVEIARSLEVSTAIDFKRAVNLSNGNVQIQYVEQDSTRVNGSFEIPKAITIRTPVYFGGDPEPVKFYFRYIARQGSLKFRLDMHRRTYVEREAFLKISGSIGDATFVPVYLGRAAS